MKNFIEKLLGLLEFEEGYKSKPYYCSEGYPTIGIGWRIGPKGALLSKYEMTVPHNVAKFILQNQVDDLVKHMEKYSWYAKQDDDRKVVLVSMAFQMGPSKLLGFKRMIAALEIKDYKTASLEAIDSLWYRQTTNRATRHASVIEHGELMLVYGELLQ